MSLPSRAHCYPYPYPLLSWMLILLEHSLQMSFDLGLSVFKNGTLKKLLGTFVSVAEFEDWSSLT